MSNPALTEAVAIKSLGEFFRDKPFVFFGSGMSCAVDNSFGMSALKDALLAGIPDSCLSVQDLEEWKAVQSDLADGKDLESAMNQVSTESLVKKITSTSAQFMVELDRKYAHQMAAGSVSWPAGALLKKLVDALPAGDPVLHVLTPNYDLLFEYQMDALGVEYTNGFHGCVQRRLDWRLAALHSYSIETNLMGRRLRNIAKPRKHARLYKVHGSLSYFFHKNAVVENNSWIWQPPPLVQRVMITPGQSKFEVLQRFRQELQGPADAAIDNASRFLFLGYGFNDVHLEEYIRRKLVTQKSQALVITRDTNPRIDSLASEADHMWVISRDQSGGTTGTRIFNKQFNKPFVLAGRELWKVDEFTKHILES